MSGNATIAGLNDAAEGSVLTSTYADPKAIELSGSCDIAGDVYVSNPSGYVSMTGNVTVRGANASDPEILDHIHIGGGDVLFPEPDPTVFEPFATNILDSNTRTDGTTTFTNLRILANTNPDFSGDITIRGVVYIETPNRVTFSGNLNITGVIVTQDTGGLDPDNNYIHFTGNTSTQGVQALPDEPQFARLRDLPGTFLLAPGFSAKFTGNFGTVNGSMAANQFQFAGNAGGTVQGWLINLGDTEMELADSANVQIDQSGVDALPSGLDQPCKLSAVPDTYEEF